MRAPARVLATIAAVAASGLLVGCTPDVTAARVQTTFGRAFARLYHLQLRELGQRPPAAILREGPNGTLHVGSSYAHARCHKGAWSGPQTGAGDDWICVEFFQRPSGAVAEAEYEVSVRTDGCMVATGPQQVVGKPQLQDPDGKTFVNPLVQFDACFST